MEDNEYRLVSEGQNTHWWWLGRKKILQTLIEDRIDLTRKLHIADVGAGFGANVPMLRQYGDVTALELNKEAILQIGTKWGESVKTVIWKSPENVATKFDLILMADVLEHIPNDREAVSWIYDHLAPGGCIVLTVPAHNYLWTDMDDVVCHFRRYNSEVMRQLFSDKFKIELLSYYNFFLFPVKLLFLSFARMRRLLFPKAEKRSFNEVPSYFVNLMFKYILYIEAKLIKRTNLPYGVSLVMLARRVD